MRYKPIIIIIILNNPIYFYTLGAKGKGLGKGLHTISKTLFRRLCLSGM